MKECSVKSCQGGKSGNLKEGVRPHLPGGQEARPPCPAPCSLVSCWASILALSSIRSRDTSCRLSSSSLVRTWWLTKSSSLLSFPLCQERDETQVRLGAQRGHNGQPRPPLPSLGSYRNPPLLTALCGSPEAFQPDMRPSLPVRPRSSRHASNHISFQEL